MKKYNTLKEIPSKYKFAACGMFQDGPYRAFKFKDTAKAFAARKLTPAQTIVVRNPWFPGKWSFAA